MSITAQGVNENTTESMAKGGHFILKTGGTTAKVFNRAVSSIEVFTGGSVTVVSGEQMQKLTDIENADDYPDWANETLTEGVYLVDFRKCELSGASGFVKVNYGV